MKPIEVYEYYKSRIDHIQRHQSRLSRVEAITSVNGMTSLESVEEIVKLTVESVKSQIAFLKEPFEEATLENYEASYIDACSQMQVFQQTPSIQRFDARQIFDGEKLLSMVTSLYRAVTLVQFALPKKIPIPDHLIVVEKVLDVIIGGLYDLFTPSGQSHVGGEGCTFTGYKMPEVIGNVKIDPIIEFRELSEQKYFTDEERAELNKREQEKQKAIEEARERAILDEQTSKAIEHMSTKGGFGDESAESFETLKRTASAHFGAGYNCLCVLFNLIDPDVKVADFLRDTKYNDSQIVIPDASLIKVKDIARANAAIKLMQVCGFVKTIKDRYFRSDYKIYGTDQSDYENSLPLATDTIVTYYAES